MQPSRSFAEELFLRIDETIETPHFQRDTIPAICSASMIFTWCKCLPR